MGAFGKSDAGDCDLLVQLNRLSVERSFTPQVDIDWSQETTPAEYESLFEVTSLLAGSPFAKELDASQRACIIQYQQINLMRFTAQLERHGIGVLAELYDADDSQPFTEYLGNFLKEEIYHYTMFTRAVGQIETAMSNLPRLPAWRIDLAMRMLFACIALTPGRRLRANLTFRFFQFAEQLSIFVHQAVQRTIPRDSSLINQVWAYHAIDEARHLAFDRMMLQRNRLRPPLSWLATSATAFCCVLLALIANANEVWAARRLGVKVKLWHLPRLLRRTTAPFKLRIQQFLKGMIRGGSAPAQPLEAHSEPAEL
jgi:hypothetical protein